MKNWTILGEYPFELLPGEPVKMADGDLSYYQYLNERWQETGKNVLCTMWLLRNFPKGLSVYEPFGGCGVFSVALQEELKPSKHVITELDPVCYEQIKHVLRSYPVEVVHGDAHELLGVTPADIYDCDFPFFTLLRHSRGEAWNTEMERMVSHKPKAIIITDGSACRYHFVAKNLQKAGFDVTADRESYAYAMSKYFWPKYGYSITGCAHHGTCFYLRAEPVPPGEIEFKHFAAGTGPKGLRPKP